MLRTAGAVAALGLAATMLASPPGVAESTVGGAAPAAAQRIITAPVAQPESLPAPVPWQPSPFGMDRSRHAAFPSATVMPDGRTLVMWRESGGHLAYDGRIVATVGDPLTGLWEPRWEVTVDNGGGPVPSVGPSGLSVIDGKVYLSYFVPVNKVASGSRYAVSEDGGKTFGPSTRTDSGMAWAANSSPVVKVGDRLILPFYGRKPGESVDTAWISYSDNDGASWTSLRIANNIGSGKAHNEPWALVRGSKLVILFRDGGWSNIGMRISPDGGRTWAAPVYNIISNATANSAATWAENGLADGVIYVVYRHTQTRAAMVASSTNAGATWQVEGTLMRVPAAAKSGTVGMTYGAPVYLDHGRVWTPFGMESTIDDSRIYGAFL